MKPPAPKSLLRAHRTLARLSRSIRPYEVQDVGGMEMWGSLVEGRRAIAVTTSYLASTVEDDALAEDYHEVWEEMIRV